MAVLALERFLPYRVNRLAAVLSRQLEAVYGQKYGLTVPEWRVLATLGQFEELTAKAIGRHSAMHKTKVSRAVKALEERRWLVRRQNAEDRREDFLSLTDRGQRCYAAIIPDMVGFEGALLERVGKKRAEAIAGALDDLERALDLPSPGREARRIPRP